MKRLIRNFTYIAGMGILTSLSGCSDDILSEITTLETSRLFSPVDIEARVVNQTGVRLTWKSVNKAKSYELEFYEGENPDFSGTPVRVVSDIAYDQLPYTVTGFIGESDYTVRVRAVGDAISESKWVTATFRTDAEQIFRAVDINEIEATEVTLRWTPGEVAGQIVLEPGNIQYTVTQSDITAGSALITGLAPETEYTARLLYNGRTRGTVTFRTILDLGGAIQVYPEDDFTAMVAAANSGDVFALMPGAYALQDLAVSKSISIKAARPAERPVLTGVVFRVSGGAALTLENLVLNGTGASNDNQTIIYDAGTYGDLKIDNCLISNYVKGAMYVNTAALIESVTITNTIYRDIECNGGDFIDFRNGLAKRFDFTNNTVYNSALARDLFRMDAGGSGNFPGQFSAINISSNTFHKVSDGNNRRFLYIRLASHGITFNKNIIANTAGYYSNQSSTTITEMSNNNYFSAPNFTASSQSGAKNDTGTYTTFDPGFANAANDDFTISHEELRFQGIGDARWRN